MTNEKAVSILQRLYEHASYGAQQSSTPIPYEEDMEALSIAIDMLSAKPEEES